MHSCETGEMSAKIRGRHGHSSFGKIAADLSGKHDGSPVIYMPNAIPYFMSFPRRSPKWIVLGGWILCFLLLLPSHRALAIGLAMKIPLTAGVTLTSTPPLFAQTSTRSQPMLPQAIADALFQDLAQRTDQPRSGFKIVTATATQWPNSCLGLAKPDEFCAQVITSGWRVEINDGQKLWVYRTDKRGKNIRLES